MPEYRGRGLATAVAAERLRWLRARGIRLAFGWVAPHNAPMLKVMERVGWRVVGRVKQLLWRSRRLPLINVVAYDPADPFAAICSPERLKFHSGLTIYRRGPVLGSHGQRESSRGGPGV